VASQSASLQPRENATPPTHDVQQMDACHLVVLFRDLVEPSVVELHEFTQCREDVPKLQQQMGIIAARTREGRSKTQSSDRRGVCGDAGAADYC